jgi:signal transduction histidine kinase
MKNALLIFFLSFLSFLCSSGQSSLPPVYEIRSTNLFFDTLHKEYWQVLEDSTGKYSFADILKPQLKSRFHYNHEDILRRNSDILAYWTRYVLKNSMDHEVNIFLGDSLNQSSEQSDFYIIDTNGKESHYTNGVLAPWSKLDGIKEFLLIPIKLNPGQELTIYRRAYNGYHFFVFVYPSPTVPIGFFNAEKKLYELYVSTWNQYYEAVHDVFIFGVLAFASLFIFLFFLNIREKTYLYFACYLFVLAIGRFNIYSEMYFVFFKERPQLYVHLLSILWFFPDFFLILFIRNLLNTRVSLPRWNTSLIILIVFYSINFLLGRLVGIIYKVNSLWATIIEFASVLIEISILVTFLLSLKFIRTNKVLMLVVLPLQCIWCILRAILHVTETLWFVFNRYQVYQIKIFSVLHDNWYGLETILLVALVTAFSWILLRRYGDLKRMIVAKELERQIERSHLIEQQKLVLNEEVTNRTAELRKSLEDLRSTQTQLIQQEKMASLGEMTAGIAHEIQNPLNFVNNFSEVNAELLKEMKLELDKGNFSEAKSVAETIIQNEEKIINHGKRADGIVKGMLQHSQLSTAIKERTDINKLADEYFRLAYHGMRARDKNFNVKMESGLDQQAGKVNIIPQDIGRVLLNLFNNAFYAVTEKKKSNISGYEPIVSLTTKRLDHRIEISIRDNGSGVPEKIKEKIFQPFFTTKPAGEGTGLGLSLAYDIIKAHGGIIKVETKEGEGSEFVIHLPYN